MSVIVERETTHPLLSEVFISAVYAVLLGFLGTYAMIDFLRSRKGPAAGGDAHGGPASGTPAMAVKLQALSLPPIIRFDEDFVPGDTFGQGLFFASMLSPHLGGPTITGNRAYDTPYLHTTYGDLRVYQCPSFRSAKATTVPFTLHYTINSIDFELYNRTRTYGPAPYQKMSSIAGGPSEVAYFAEINSNGPLGHQLKDYRGTQPSGQPYRP